MYGICPLGHNIVPSGDTGDNLSTTQIDEGEPKPLFWSDYYQDYVCKMHMNRIEDDKNEKPFSEDSNDLQKRLSGMGFVNQTSDHT